MVGIVEALYCFLLCLLGVMGAMGRPVTLCKVYLSTSPRLVFLGAQVLRTPVYKRANRYKWCKRSGG